MQRPVMNPSFYEEAPTPPSGVKRLLRLAAQTSWRTLRWIYKVLTYDPLARIPGFRVEDGTPTSRFIRGLLYRVAFLPILMAGAACAIVWTSTHPRTYGVEVDPASQGIYYEPVNLLGADQAQLDAWLVPVLDAKTVLQEKDRVLWAKRPAVVLIHDLGRRRDQMLPLIKPLHEAGYVVVALNLRGGGTRACLGETFGLQEATDVRAAVDMLRRRPFVDPNRVALIGYGTGASAALLVANTDSQIGAIVAVQPVTDARQIIRSHVMPQTAGLSWLAPLCKWTFEMSYGVDIDELDMDNFKRLFDSRPVLMPDIAATYPDPSDPRSIEQMKSFLNSSMPAKDGLAGIK